MQTQSFWISDSKTYPPAKLQQKKSSYERYMSFLSQPINSASKQVLLRNKSNLLLKYPNQYDNYFYVWKRSLFGKFNFSNSRFEAWRFYARLFFLLFTKVVIVLLNYRLSTLVMTIIILEDTNRLEGYGV